MHELRRWHWSLILHKALLSRSCYSVLLQLILKHRNTIPTNTKHENPNNQENLKHIKQIEKRDNKQTTENRYNFERQKLYIYIYI